MKYFKFSAEEVIKSKRTNRGFIEQIKKWCVTKENIPLLSDEFIVLFLISCENKLELAKETIVSYFLCKTQAPEIFNNRDVERLDLQQGLDVLYMSAFPVRTKENYCIHYFKLRDTNFSNLELIPGIKLAYMMLEITLQNSPTDGLVAVLDMEGVKRFEPMHSRSQLVGFIVGLLHLTRVRLGAVRHFFQFLQEGMPMQIKEIHVLNTASYIDKFLALVRCFMKPELMDLIKTHPPGMDMNDFFKYHLPKSCMPKNYGGTLPSIDDLQEETKKQLKNLQPYFEYEEHMRKNVHLHKQIHSLKEK